MILLSAMAAYEFVRAPISRRLLVRILPLLLVCLALTAFALSNKVAVATHVWNISQCVTT